MVIMNCFEGTYPTALWNVLEHYFDFLRERDGQPDVNYHYHKVLSDYNCRTERDDDAYTTRLIFDSEYDAFKFVVRFSLPGRVFHNWISGENFIYSEYKWHR